MRGRTYRAASSSRCRRRECAGAAFWSWEHPGVRRGLGERGDGPLRMAGPPGLAWSALFYRLMCIHQHRGIALSPRGTRVSGDGRRAMDGDGHGGMKRCTGDTRQASHFGAAAEESSFIPGTSGAQARPTPSSISSRSGGHNPGAAMLPRPGVHTTPSNATACLRGSTGAVPPVLCPMPQHAAPQ